MRNTIDFHHKRTIRTLIKALGLTVRSLTASLFHEHLSLQDDLSRSRNQKIVRSALDEFHRSASPASSDGVFGVFQLVGKHRLSRHIGQEGIHPDGDGHGSRFP